MAVSRIYVVLLALVLLGLVYFDAQAQEEDRYRVDEMAVMRLGGPVGAEHNGDIWILVGGDSGFLVQRLVEIRRKGFGGTFAVAVHDEAEYREVEGLVADPRWESVRPVDVFHYPRPIVAVLTGRFLFEAAHQYLARRAPRAGLIVLGDVFEIVWCGALDSLRGNVKVVTWRYPDYQTLFRWASNAVYGSVVAALHNSPAVSPHFVAGDAEPMRAFLDHAMVELRRTPAGLPVLAQISKAAREVSAEVLSTSFHTPLTASLCKRLRQYPMVENCHGYHLLTDVGRCARGPQHVQVEAPCRRMISFNRTCLMTPRRDGALEAAVENATVRQRLEQLRQELPRAPWPDSGSGNFSSCLYGKRQAVLGMCGRYTPSVVRLFLSTFRRSRDPRCTTLYVFVKDPAAWEQEAFGGVRVVDQRGYEPRLKTNLCPAPEMRSELMLQWLMQHGGAEEIGSVMVVDTRDLFFQRDPFAGYGEAVEALPRGEAALVFPVEGYPLQFADWMARRSFTTNSGWLSDTYGTRFVKRLAAASLPCSNDSFPVINSGMYFGTVEAMLQLLFMLAELVHASGECRPDQPILMGLVAGLARTAGLNASMVLLNPFDSLYTQKPPNWFHVRWRSTGAGPRLFNCRGEVYAVVHQLDRHKHIWGNMGGAMSA
jgi:hypothetical protein